ncbi:MAG: hypothetical protein ACJ79D_12010 [Myxococcales bacterium]
MLRFAAGIGIIAFALVASHLSEAVDLFRFPIAWWGIVLALDGAVRARHGSSPFGRPADFVVCALASVAFWDAFELLNLRLHDWWYVGVPRSALAGAAFSAISYATVLPAVRLALALVAKPPGTERIVAIPARPGTGWLLAGAGIAMLLAALVAPRVAFPLAWIFLWPLCEAVLAGRRDDAPRLASPLQALRAGRRDLPLRALAVALPFGVAWESLNWGCSRGWVYTVPHFERPKLFEMPIAGYLGYLPFLLECASALALVERLRRNRGVWVLAIALFHVAADGLGRGTTVLSVTPDVADVASLSRGEREGLERRGLRTPKAILGASDVPDRVRRLSELASVAHMGFFWAERLETAQVWNRAALASAQDVALWTRLAATGPAPRPEVVRLWISAAVRDSR